MGQHFGKKISYQINDEIMTTMTLHVEENNNPFFATVYLEKCVADESNDVTYINDDID